MQYSLAFARLEDFLPFLHIVSVVLFVGLQLALLVCGYQLLKGEQKISILLRIVRACTPFVFISMFLICVSGVFGLFAGAKREISDPMAQALLATKVSLLIFSMLNCIYMLYHTQKSWAFFKAKKQIQAHESMVLLIYYFVPLNIVIMLVATYLGISYRSFV